MQHQNLRVGLITSSPSNVVEIGEKCQNHGSIPRRIMAFCKSTSVQQERPRAMNNELGDQP